MHNFIGITNKANNFRKGVFTDPYDEPVYLTFALDFNFDSTKTILNSEKPELAPLLWDSPLFNEKSGGAIEFLSNRNYLDHANGLAIFKKILRYLTFDAPWYFQSISGLDNFWKGATDISAGNKSNGAEITIETLEAIDLRVTELANLYRTAIYDKVNLRERVPDNLRWFSLDIYIAEARNMRFRLPGVGQNVANTLGVNTGALGNIVGGGNAISNVLKQYGYLKFKCRQCEFDFSGSYAGGQKSSVSMFDTKAATNSFKIKVGYFEEESEYADNTKLFDDLTRSSRVNDPWGLRDVGTTLSNVGSFLTGLPLIGDNIQNAGQSAQNALAQIGGLINPALGAASNFLEPPISDLGNVYGNR
jgi:hypothetical protein